MTEQLHPVKYLETLRGNIANLFLFNDGLKYVIKFKDHKKRVKEVVNEYVVGRLGELLSLPVLPMKLVYCSDDMMRTLPKAVKNMGGKPGYHIAWPYIENCIAFVEASPPSKEQVVNREALAGMIVFDLWINNSDRSQSNILLQPVVDGCRFHMIDHGRCFPGRYTWTAETLKETVQPRVNMPVYKWATSLLYEEDELRAFTKHIEAITDEAIQEAIQSVPDDWRVSTADKEALFHFLVQQRRTLPDVVDMYIERYRHLIKADGSQ